MDFRFTEEQLMIQDVARRIAEWAAVIAERSEAPQDVPVAEG